MNKEEAASLGEKKKVKKDKRNLHLVQEGRITSNSDAAEGLKRSELSKRERCDKEKHEKLRSPLFFVSPSRLAVQNLSTTGKDLTTILRRTLRCDLLLTYYSCHLQHKTLILVTPSYPSNVTLEHRYRTESCTGWTCSKEGELESSGDTSSSRR